MKKIITIITCFAALANFNPVHAQQRASEDEMLRYFKRMLGDPGRITARKSLPHDYRLQLMFESVQNEAKKGRTQAQYKLGLMYLKGKKVGKMEIPKDHEKAAHWFRQAAKQNHTKAQYQLGMALKRINEQHRTYDKAKEAVHNWQKAADKGHAEAQYELGLMYSSGMGGLPKDMGKTFTLWHKAAEAGSVQAMDGLNVFYARKGPFQDKKQAVHWNQQAAKLGDIDAQTSLAYRYQKGRDVPQNNAKALYWFKRAAQSGDALAQRRLGSIYHNHEWTPAYDELLAYGWWYQAAMNGSTRAQFKLGYAFAKGEIGSGIDRDLKQSYVWFAMASANGYKAAEPYRDFLATKLKSEELNAASEAFRIIHDMQTTIAKGTQELDPLSLTY